MASAKAEAMKVISPIRKRTESEEETLKALKTEFDFTQDRKNSVREPRSLLVDEETFIETFLRCLICQELYDDICRPPKLLHCHHSLCLECIFLIFQKEAEYRRSLTPAITELPTAVTIICPTCRTNFIATQEGIQELPTDHRIIQLIDFVKHTERLTTDFCSNHKYQALNFFCELCSIYICRDCTIVDHQEACGHTVVDFESALKKYLPIIEKAMTEINNEKESIKKKQAQVEEAIQNLDKEETTVVDSIKETFERIRKVMEEREQEMIEMAQREVGNEKNKLKEKSALMDKRTEALDQKLDELSKTKEEGKIENLYQTSHRYSSYRSEPVIKVREIDDGFVAKCTFNNRDENNITQKLQNFGDVSTRIESVYSGSSSALRSSSSEDRYGISRYSSESRYSGVGSSSSPSYNRYSSAYNRYSYR